MEAQVNKPIIASLAILLLTSQAQAVCFTQPDTASSRYVNNGVAQTLCQQDALSNKSRTIDDKAQLDSLRIDLQRLQIQRKFDNLNHP
jgi:hypothetical protein